MRNDGGNKMEKKLNFGQLAKREGREKLAINLGWFSIGLGVAELLFPGTLCRLVGVKPRRFLTRLLGAREIASGIGLLNQPAKGPWLKARVAGDAMDLSLLALAATSDKSKKGKLALAFASVAGVTAVDFLCYKDFVDGQPEPTDPEFARSPDVVHFRRSLVINRPIEELYQIWRNFSELPRYMRNLISVGERERNRWHWKSRGPGETEVEWEAEVTRDISNQAIEWRTLPGADLDHKGSVQFEPAPGGRGTIVRVEMQYRAPAGKPGAIITKLLGKSPEHQISADLLRFKQFLETGEIATTRGQPAGRAHSTSRKFDDFVRTE
jgi:uncharacterized membrane protein